MCKPVNLSVLTSPIVPSPRCGQQEEEQVGYATAAVVAARDQPRGHCDKHFRDKRNSDSGCRFPQEVKVNMSRRWRESVISQSGDHIVHMLQQS